MQRHPLWATPDRQAKLMELYAQHWPEIIVQFYDNLDVVVFGDMTIAEYLDFLTKDIGHNLIEFWKEDDRWERAALWQLEKRRLHALPKIKRRGPFDSIAREQYLADRPVFKIVGMGVSAFTQHRIAKVLLPELHKVIWVDLWGVPIKKNKLRKLANGKGKVPDEVFSAISKAARRYL